MTDGAGDWSQAPAACSARRPSGGTRQFSGSTGGGFADLLRSTSLYRRLDSHVRDPLLDAIAERIRMRMGDRASRRYLSVLRAGQHAE
jgi:hypothetical protein